jgi:hypothetical protein
MNLSQDTISRNIFANIGHSLGRTRSGQLLVSVVVVAWFCGLACAAWYFRDAVRELVVDVLVLGLIFHGFRRAWPLLPISQATRARWAHDEKISQRCPAYFWSLLLPIGILGTIFGFWKSGPVAAFALPPGNGLLFIVIGIVSRIRCYRFVRAEKDRLGSSSPCNAVAG